VSISVGSNAVSHRSHTGNANSADNAGSKAQARSAGTTDTSSSSSTSVTLSDAAKAFLARKASATDGDQPSVATLTTNARAWFDQQYASLGISSAMLDGKVAVDLSDQTRATLSVVADNAQSQFTPDEVAAATKTLQSRFDDAISPHVAIARHTGDYASLYAAASDYLDRAGDAEKATQAWKDQKQAVLVGLDAAKASFGKAPATGNDNDPVTALLDKPSAQTPVTKGSSPDVLATNARAMLDAQAGSAKDNGKELVFTGGRQTGQQVDFSQFDNRTLAVMALNTDSSFSVQEASAAKTELNQRTRSNMLNAFDPSNGGGAQGSSLALLQQYASMSPEERSVLGFTDDFANKIAQNYRTMLSIQSSFGSGSSAGLAAYL
jgi:hypothetical protein